MGAFVGALILAGIFVFGIDEVIYQLKRIANALEAIAETRKENKDWGSGHVGD